VGGCTAVSYINPLYFLNSIHTKEHTIENAVMLPKKFAKPIAAGVRRVTRRRGITGCELQKASTHTNAGHSTALAANRPSTVGEVQGISSVVLREKARRRVETAPTRVAEPRKSILCEKRGIRLRVKHGRRIGVLSKLGLEWLVRNRIGELDVYLEVDNDKGQQEERYLNFVSIT
jgi:hypothetical protein